MKKRVFIIHGWNGSPEEGWFPWLKNKLEAKGFEVYVPQLRNTEIPKINKWIPQLAKIVGRPDKNNYFVGHSIGCQAIARYLETLPKRIRVGGAVFVAGFFKRLTGLDDVKEIQDWLQAPIDLSKVKSRLPKSIAVFSDNDRYVPLDNQDDFRDKLGSKIVIEHNAGHFSAHTDGTTKLPIALKSLLSIAKRS